jgi:hypothetical protein
MVLDMVDSIYLLTKIYSFGHKNCIVSFILNLWVG